MFILMKLSVFLGFFDIAVCYKLMSAMPLFRMLIICRY